MAPGGRSTCQPWLCQGVLRSSTLLRALALLVRPWGQKPQVGVSVQTLGKPFNFPGPWSSHLEDGDNVMLIS